MIFSCIYFPFVFLLLFVVHVHFSVFFPPWFLEHLFMKYINSDFANSSFELARWAVCPNPVQSVLLWFSFWKLGGICHFEVSLISSHNIFHLAELGGSPWSYGARRTVQAAARGSVGLEHMDGVFLPPSCSFWALGMLDNWPRAHSGLLVLEVRCDHSDVSWASARGGLPAAREAFSLAPSWGSFVIMPVHLNRQLLGD